MLLQKLSIASNAMLNISEISRALFLAARHQLIVNVCLIDRPIVHRRLQNPRYRPLLHQRYL